MSRSKCCVPGCTVISGNGLPLHCFPNPSNFNQMERFRTWLMNVGGDIVGDNNVFIYKNRRVCHKHFLEKQILPNGRLTCDSIPLLCLPGMSDECAATRQSPFLEPEFVSCSDDNIQVPSPSTSIAASDTDVPDDQFDGMEPTHESYSQFDQKNIGYCYMEIIILFLLYSLLFIFPIN